MVEIRAAIVVLTFLKITSLSCLEEKIISNIFSFRGYRTLKPRLKFILKNLIFFNLKDRKLEFNTPLKLALSF